jgi:purine-nucleoside phosphorylase
VADAAALAALMDSAHRLGVDLGGGVFCTTSTLYREGSFIEKWASLGVVGIEMEAAPHYLLSHLHGKRAAGLYAISDSPLQGDEIWRTGVALDGVLLAAYTRLVDVLLGAIQALSSCPA